MYHLIAVMTYQTRRRAVNVLDVAICVDQDSRSVLAIGATVGNLELPPWASDAQDFVQKLADALECPAVSMRLHRWIDLIFGYRSRGHKAEAADNVFPYLTYDDMCGLPSVLCSLSI